MSFWLELASIMGRRSFKSILQTLDERTEQARVDVEKREAKIGAKSIFHTSIFNSEEKTIRLKCQLPF
jgi:hypothetical protein